MKSKNIPKTDSIQQPTDFWDMHDLTDFEDELEEVDEPVFELSVRLFVPLAPGELETLNTLAQSRRMSLKT